MSTQAAELTKRFSGGRAELFPATFLETIVTTQLGRDSKTKKEKKKHHGKSLVDGAKTLCGFARVHHIRLFLRQTAPRSSQFRRALCEEEKKRFSASSWSRVQIRTTGIGGSVALLRPRSSLAFLTVAGSE